MNQTLTSGAFQVYPIHASTGTVMILKTKNQMMVVPDNIASYRGVPTQLW